MDVAALADRLAIQDTLHRYCRGLDRMDKALALSVFHAQSKVEYDHMFAGSGAAFIDWVWEQHRGMARHSHNITNLYVEIDGERAASEAYALVVLRFETEAGVSVVQNLGRYLDEWQRDGGRWTIRRRRYVHEFQETRLLADDAVPAARTSSRRDGGDPSYALQPALNFQ
jgi:hypothetical protein